MPLSKLIDISALPESIQVNLSDFCEFLLQKYSRNNETVSDSSRKPGSAKGKFTVPPEFFEPLPEEIAGGFEQ